MGKGCHEGSVKLNHSFNKAFDYLTQKGSCELKTARNTIFKAMASETNDSRKVIKFYQNVKDQNEKEYARSYPCCWGHKKNCGGTIIRMYCVALDQSIR